MYITCSSEIDVPKNVEPPIVIPHPIGDNRMSSEDVGNGLNDYVGDSHTTDEAYKSKHCS